MILTVLTCLYCFAHSTPERAIRANLLEDGYFVKAFTTEVYKNYLDPQYGQKYSCRNPRVGVDHYSCVKEFGVLWYVNPYGTGEG